LQELGLLQPGFTALCTSRLSEEESEIIAKTGIALIACPQASLRLGGNVCSLMSLDSRNVSVGLGTDSPAAAGALDMLAEARIAALVGETADRGITADAGGSASVWAAGGPGTWGVSGASENMLRAATFGGANALGLGALVGSIESGKVADLVCLDLGGLAHQPLARPADTILFSATRGDVTDVWTSGRAAVSAGRLLAFDEQKLLALAHQWAERTRVLI
jgi:5-methylthioadenosine/S-adenosylhomocysteine deaminase